METEETSMSESERPDDSVDDALYSELYQELRRIAERHMSRERRGHTLDPTALVNETYLKLRSQQHLKWNDRGHFVALASRAMRQVLIDYARRRASRRRAADRVDLDLALIEETGRFSLGEILTVHEALDRLGAQRPRGARHARLVEWVWLGGMPLNEAANHLGITERQAQRDWAWARTWLMRELSR